MDLEDFKDIALVNDLSFMYLGNEFSIIMDNNSYLAVDNNGSITKFNKYNNVYDDLDDMLNNWIIEGKKLKDLIEDIELL